MWSTCTYPCTCMHTPRPQHDHWLLWYACEGVSCSRKPGACICFIVACLVAIVAWGGCRPCGLCWHSNCRHDICILWVNVAYQSRLAHEVDRGFLAMGHTALQGGGEGGGVMEEVLAGNPVPVVGHSSNLTPERADQGVAMFWEPLAVARKLMWIHGEEWYILSRSCCAGSP
jgi:hypothetical protein